MTQKKIRRMRRFGLCDAERMAIRTLEFDRCPHCGIASPNMNAVFNDSSTSGFWRVLKCNTCTCLTVVNLDGNNKARVWPSAKNVPDAVPERAREFLLQAGASIHSPAGAVMLTASSVDAMLKAKGYKAGNLNSRIKKAAEEHLITKEMSDWAHEIRLDANDQRHADEEAPLPSKADAERCLTFAHALAEFLFILPARVAEGRASEAVPK